MNEFDLQTLYQSDLARGIEYAGRSRRDDKGFIVKLLSDLEQAHSQQSLDFAPGTYGQVTDFYEAQLPHPKNTHRLGFSHSGQGSGYVDGAFTVLKWTVEDLMKKSWLTVILLNTRQQIHEFNYGAKLAGMNRTMEGTISDQASIFIRHWADSNTRSTPLPIEMLDLSMFNTRA